MVSGGGSTPGGAGRSDEPPENSCLAAGARGAFTENTPEDMTPCAQAVQATADDLVRRS